MKHAAQFRLAMQLNSKHPRTSMQGGFGMKTSAVTSILRVLVLVCVVALTASGAWAGVNTSADTFVLSDEAPGHLITALVNAGYGNDNLYQALVAVQQATGSTEAVPDSFLALLQQCPAGSEIFTTKLNTIPAGAAVAISTDGVVQTVNVYLWQYYNQPGFASLSYPTVNYNGNVIPTYFVHSTGSTPLATWQVTGGIITTTYKVFAIGSGSVTQVAVPTMTEWGTMIFALLIAAGAAYVLRRT
jgi:hypothetical protein